MPNPSNPQAWNRFSYVKNNPVIRIDPGGHDDVITFIIGTVVLVTVLYDLSRRHDTGGNCHSSLADCFNANSIKKFSPNEVIDSTEFNDLQEAVYQDLNRKLVRTAWDPARGGYDTPFFDGNGRRGDKTNVDQVVCIQSKCSNQSYVNYFAQGMYSAHAGQSLKTAKFQVLLWNLGYFHLPNDDEYYWLEQGYNKYKEIDERLKPKSSTKNNKSTRVSKTQLAH